MLEREGSELMAEDGFSAAAGTVQVNVAARAILKRKRDPPFIPKCKPLVRKEGSRPLQLQRCGTASVAPLGPPQPSSPLASVARRCSPTKGSKDAGLLASALIAISADRACAARSPALKIRQTGAGLAKSP